MTNQELHLSRIMNTCHRCGGSMAIEMSGLMSYRACLRCGRGRADSPGPLASAVMLFMARGR